MKLFDAHCHLADAALRSDLGNVLARAAEAGVSGLVCCGTSPDDWQSVCELPQQFPQILPMVGIHPWWVTAHWRAEFQTLGERLRENPRAGLGETGLDFQPRLINRAEQEASFAAHLDLARELNLPVAVHCVQAWGPLLAILRTHPAPKVLLHAFGGAAQLIPELIELNCWFSFSGAVTNPRMKRMREAAVAVPARRLLIETDAPDFPPAGCAQPNEPANLVQVARTLAAWRGVSVEELAAQTVAVAEDFFGSV